MTSFITDISLKTLPAEWTGINTTHQCYIYSLWEILSKILNTRANECFDYCNLCCLSWSLAECVRLLEEKMGIKSSNVQNRRPKTKKSDSTRNPFGKLKELFRPRNRKVSSTPTSDVTSDSIEMRSLDNKSMTNSERSLKELAKREESRQPSKAQSQEGKKVQQENPASITVPKIVLSTFDETKEDDQGLLKQRKRSRRHKKVRRPSLFLM